MSFRYGVTGSVIWILETIVTMTNMRVRETITRSWIRDDQEHFINILELTVKSVSSK